MICSLCGRDHPGFCGAAESKIVVQKLSKMEISYACGIGASNFAMHQRAYAVGEAVYDEKSERGGESNGWDSVVSKVAEYATAKALNRFWPGCWWEKKKDIDIPPDIQVRWTIHPPPKGHLLGYSDDNPDHKFVFVYGSVPTFYLRGWATGKELLAQPMRPLKPGRPPFHVWEDSDTLRDVRELIVG